MLLVGKQHRPERRFLGLRVLLKALCGVSQTLAAVFPRSDWVVMQAATAQYNLRNFDEAQELFEGLLERDPHRIEVKYRIRY